MELRWEEQGGTLRLYLAGELDHHGARELMVRMEERIDSALPRRCVMDLSGLGFMDSSGIAVLLRAWRSMKALEGSLQVVGVPAQARRMLEAAGIHRMIKLEEGSNT